MGIMSDRKRCTRCGATKLLSEFHKNRRRPDGRNTWCKNCACQATREHDAKKKGKTLPKEQKFGVVSAAPKVDVDSDFYWKPPELDDMERVLSTGGHVLLLGPAGTGKSMLAQEALRVRNPLRIDFTNGTEEEHIVGQNQLVIEDGKQVTQFVPAVLYEAVRDGRPLIIEELTAAQAGVQFCLHSVLNGDPLVVTCNGIDEVPVAAGFQVVATSNTIGLGDDDAQYADTNQMNEALRDRFDAIIPLWYMPKVEEIKVARKNTGCDEVTAREIVDLANLARDAMKGRKLFSTFSTRKVLSYCKQVMVGLSKSKALLYAVLSKVSEEDAKAIKEMSHRVMKAGM